MGDRGNYGLTYVVGVDETYCVMPEKGELPYEMAEKSPKKFYAEVMNTNVKEHRVQKSPVRTKKVIRRGAFGEKEVKRVKSGKKKLVYSATICKRSVARILMVVQQKVLNILKKETGNRVPAQLIRQASDHPTAQQLLQR